MADVAEYLSKLNPAQARAARHGCRSETGFEAGPLLIIAGAGTGKTNTLAHRVGHLLVEGVDPSRILLLTFTRRAAQEMTRRARRIAADALGEKRQQARAITWAGTFHAIANRLLRIYATQVGLEDQFSIADRGDAADLMDVLRHELGYSKKSRRFPKKDTCLEIYSRRVNTQVDLEKTLRDHYPWCLEWCAELTSLYRCYVDTKQHHQTLDYDDLLLYWYYLMQEPGLAEAVASRFDHVLVDEYQDTNRLQAEILGRLSPDGVGVTVVGDDAQSIYSFRAAAVENILEFPARYSPAAEIVKLERNYRSVQPILDAANTLMAEASRSYQKALYSEKTSQQKPYYVTVESLDDQVQYVVERVLANREEGRRLKDQAVLFRTSHHADLLELELMRRNIPYVKYGGLKFLESAHVKDFLSVLRWTENPRNRVAAFRVLKMLPGMGPQSAARCYEFLETNHFMLDKLGHCPVPGQARGNWPGLCAVLNELNRGDADWISGLSALRAWYQPFLERQYDAPEARAGDLDQLEQIAPKYPNRERFLTELTLDPPEATSDYAAPPHLDEDFLILSTVHSAKGQEWDSVFIINVSDGTFPNEFAAGNPALIEEERRLLYVGMTRAKEDLHLVCPLKYFVVQQRKHGDRHVYGAQSRFMTDGVLARLERAWYPAGEGSGHEAETPALTVDVGARIKEMW